MTYDEYKLATPPESEFMDELNCDQCGEDFKTFHPEHFVVYSEAFIKPLGKVVKFRDVTCPKCQTPKTKAMTKLEQAFNMIEELKKINDIDAEVSITLSNCDLEDLQRIANFKSLHLFTPLETLPHYWIKIKDENYSVVLKTNDYKLQTTWKSE